MIIESYNRPRSNKEKSNWIILDFLSKNISKNFKYFLSFILFLDMVILIFSITYAKYCFVYIIVIFFLLPFLLFDLGNNSIRNFFKKYYIENQYEEARGWYFVSISFILCCYTYNPKNFEFYIRWFIIISLIFEECLIENEIYSRLDLCDEVSEEQDMDDSLTRIPKISI